MVEEEAKVKKFKIVCFSSCKHGGAKRVMLHEQEIETETVFCGWSGVLGAESGRNASSRTKLTSSSKMMCTASLRQIVGFIVLSSEL